MSRWKNKTLCLKNSLLPNEKKEPFSGSLPQFLGFLALHLGLGFLGVPGLVDVLGSG